MSAQLTHQGIQARTPQPVTAGGHGWLRSVWQRIRRGLGEMNYASQRVVEVQAPWSVDSRWHQR